MEAWRINRPARLPGTGPPLRAYDTATGELRPVAPRMTVRMYVCGITPYDATHLGHAMTYLTYDLAFRVFLDAGHDVRYVQNVTDVDDPLFERAAEINEDWTRLAKREIEQFRGDMLALNVLPPTAFVGAIEAIPLIVSLITRLREAGVTYQVDDDLYLSTEAFPRFGSIGHYDLDTMIALAREFGGDPDRPGKKHPLDPPLWLAWKLGEPSWEAPWGPGRPGWHVECAAIATSRLGPTMDLHGGGTDLIFPHHEMSAATAALATGEWPFARSWVHTAMVGLHGEKMSKSRGNLVFVRHLRLAHDPAAIRLALLAHHYRTEWEWFESDIVRGEERLARWRSAVARPAAGDAGPLLDSVRRHLADDLDAPGAIEAFDAWAAAGGTDPDAPALARQVADTLLGVRL